MTLTGTHNENMNTTWIEVKVLDYLPAAQMGGGKKSCVCVYLTAWGCACVHAKCTISKCRYRYFNVMVISGNSQV